MLPVRQQIGGLGNLMFKQAYLYALMRDGIIPDIYVQEQDYWERYKDEVKQLFGEGIGYSDYVALQIRRGDYLKTDFYINLWETDYYQKAVALFPDSRFLVFCHDNQDPQQDYEDKEWCKRFLNEFIPDRYLMWEAGEETDDLNAMASCKAKIIANSTFGWWAGFLGKGEVVCPAQWFTDGIQRTQLLEEWKKI